MMIGEWCLMSHGVVCSFSTFTIVSFIVWSVDFLKRIWVGSNILLIVTTSDRNFGWILEVMTLVHMDMEDEVNHGWFTVDLLDVRPIGKLLILNSYQQWSALFDSWSSGVSSKAPNVILLVTC